MMMSPYITAVRLAAVFLFAIYTVNVNAQAAVRESSPVTATATTNAIPAAASPSTTVVAPASPVPPPATSPNLAYQIQQLQQEILELRGLLEEQSFELKRLKQQRLDDYLDLDKRLSELNTQSEQKVVGNQQTTASLVNAANDTEAEKKLYRGAIDQLLKQQDYKGAQDSFSQYLNDYPQGTYIPNVYYWQGQIYLTQSNKSAAEKSFATLVQNYPDHQKSPDAKYKLATIYFDQGKKTEAKGLLDEVVASNTDASRLAKAFIANQYK